jgi:uncharacterized protein
LAKSEQRRYNDYTLLLEESWCKSMKINDIPVLIAKELGVTPKQTSAAIELLDGGNTVPFIARYRKEATGALEDEQLRTLEERLTYLRNLVKRQEEILGKIEEQGKLTDELKAAIEKAQKLQELEDLYLPYKQKKRTRAQIARERGLEPLAQMMLEQATRYKIPRGLPEGVECGNKSGETDTIANDAAVIYGPTADYILVVLSNDWSNEDTANAQIAEVSAAVYAFFEH